MAFERAERRWTLAAAVLGSALWFTDTSAIAILVPVIQRDFGTGITSAQWVVEAQILFLAALLLTGGALGDRFGRRRVFMSGLALYAVASLGAALAPTVNGLIAMRAVQGVGAALLVPGSLALITAGFPKGERGRAFGIWSAMTGIAAGGGPVLAGYLADAFTWRAFFLLFVPYALGIILVLTRVPESRSEDARALDGVGALLATVGLGGLTFGLLEGNRFGWGSPLVVGALAAGVLGLVGFVAWEKRAPVPMLPLEMFRSRNFSAANAITLLVYAALSGALFFIPINLQNVQGYTAFFAGLAPLPFNVLMATLSPFAGRLSDRVGARWPLAVGGVIAAAGFVAFSRAGTDASYWWTFFPGFVLLGTGLAIFVPSITATVMDAAPPTRSGIASGVNNALARAAGLLAIAVFGVLVVAVFTHALPEDARVALGDDVSLLAAGEAVPGAGDVPDRVVDEAFVAAFRVVMLVSAGLVLVGSAIAAAVVRAP